MAASGGGQAGQGGATEGAARGWAELLLLLRGDGAKVARHGEGCSCSSTAYIGATQLRVTTACATH